MNTWPARDVTDAVRNLPPDSATARAEMGDTWDWNHLAANIADLVDLASFWLEAEYAKWIHDPDDPETKAAERERKAAGVKPPPRPLIPPVAHRPASVAEQYLARFAELVPDASTRPEPRSGKRFVSSADFDLAMGLA